MNLLESLLQANGGSVVDALGTKVGLSGADAERAVRSLTPALTEGLGQNLKEAGGVASLMDALRGGDHGRFLDRPEALQSEEAVEEGNAILGHVLGSKDASRAAVERAAGETGIDAGILKRMLPMLAAALMGAMSKQTGEKGPLSQLTGDAAGSSLLQGLLGGGGAAGNLTDSVKKLF